MGQRLAFTKASMVRAIKAVEMAGLFVIGAKPDGTLIIGEKPLDTSSLVPVPVQNDPDSSWRDQGQ